MEKESLDKLHNTDTDTENVNKKTETRNKKQIFKQISM